MFGFVVVEGATVRKGFIGAKLGRSRSCASI